MRIILAATLSIPPFNPGMAWNWIQHVKGLLRLGHDAYFLDLVDSTCSIDRVGRPVAPADSENAALFHASLSQAELLDRSFLLDPEAGEVIVGGTIDELRDVIRTADLAIGMSGCPKILDDAKRRVYVDQDPVYTQLWCSEYDVDLGLATYDVCLTVGLNIGTARSPIPDLGIQWRHVLPPVIVADWTTATPPRAGRPFTTIASWSWGYTDLAYGEQWYSGKPPEFAKLAKIPRAVDHEFEVRLRPDDFDPNEEGIKAIVDGGWQIHDASAIGNLDAYRAFIARSYAEIGVAKNAYVSSRSGWFSDRSAHYLATGRPVLAQSTGLEEVLDVGEGFLTFRTLDEAIAGVEAINAHYTEHQAAAREFARAYLDHRVVLPNMLEAAYAR